MDFYHMTLPSKTPIRSGIIKIDLASNDVAAFAGGFIGGVPDVQAPDNTMQVWIQSMMDQMHAQHAALLAEMNEIYRNGRA